MFADLLRGHAKDTLKHARELGDRIVSLGGVSSVQIGEVKQSPDTQEMLRQDLEQHRAAVAKIDKTIETADARKIVALRVLLEEMSYEETQFLEELEKALSLKQVSIGRMGSTVRRARTGSARSVNSTTPGPHLYAKHEPGANSPPTLCLILRPKWESVHPQHLCPRHSHLTRQDNLVSTKLINIRF